MDLIKQLEGKKIDSEKVKEALFNIIDENKNGKIELIEVAKAITKLEAIISQFLL